MEIFIITYLAIGMFSAVFGYFMDKIGTPFIKYLWTGLWWPILMLFIVVRLIANRK